jgi:hypothetical protein
MVIPPARTGRDRSRRTAVINTAHTNRGILWNDIPGHRIFRIVVIKFIAPNIDEIPAKCRLKIAKSTDPPECDAIPDSGGYTVHPVPAPCSTKELATSKIKEGGSNQKLMLLSRGNAISGAPIIKGTNQLPNPESKPGITKKKIIMKAWAVTITLYN